MAYGGNIMTKLKEVQRGLNATWIQAETVLVVVFVSVFKHNQFHVWGVWLIHFCNTSFFLTVYNAVIH